ncbi:UDP-2,3-diacylglucosamine diphosphatase [Porphyromonas circumdentaria]|uniref:UDP-2,3-diacylglucosamine hydrolase n=1 Tax=Porphyromonas circumdentaria TaxID=29524 RepID=A0A1T4N874_9PORP|nr:UDP-2,3-diacylglucosamine diphosphatase [Porphyromonas circumdentaria]MBB6276070.1 UDP-2,3-diacylglucosamine hydrolase [Porphyromonas circumdentaria]MDO4722458.1 UDP-2,3-diacylglucosamine diphosphatase [Porphyromonas circumdentaria]SJZ75412.1 UDP-2,3-diacylglucosamine hydrolase [Porphyromonas circumdentaria]
MIYFTSDAHLGSPYHNDPRATEMRLVAWLNRIAHDAEAIYFLGDMFDFWYEYRYVVPKGFVRFQGKIAELVDKGVEIHFLTGNHDVWMKDYFQKELGVQIHYQAIEVTLKEKRFRLAHGDEEYRYQKRINDLIYRLFRNRIAQFLFSAIHPRWTVGFALGCSLQSRRHGQKEKEVAHTTYNPYFSLEEEWLVKWVKRKAPLHPEIDFFLFGHRHLPFDYLLPSGQRLLVMGDWYKTGEYITWDGNELLLEEANPI